MSHDPRDAPTPKVSTTGSLERWPFLAETSMQVFEAASENALQAEKVPWLIDIKRAKRLREVAKSAETLYKSFCSWGKQDPGADRRQELIRDLYNLRAELKAMNIDVDSYRLNPP